MKHLLYILLLSFAYIPASIAQKSKVKSKSRTYVKYSLKTNPFSILTSRIRLAGEYTMNKYIGLEVEMSIRNEDSKIRELLDEIPNVSGTIRPKIYRKGKPQDGFYIAPGLSVEKDISTFQGNVFSRNSYGIFCDLGVQIVKKHLIVDTFIGVGRVTDPPRSGGFINIGEPMGSSWTFSSGLALRLGCRIGICG